jgi:hypothetical protein
MLHAFFFHVLAKLEQTNNTYFASHSEAFTMKLNTSDKVLLIRRENKNQQKEGHKTASSSSVQLVHKSQKRKRKRKKEEGNTISNIWQKVSTFIIVRYALKKLLLKNHFIIG